MKDRLKQQAAHQAPPPAFLRSVIKQHEEKPEKVLDDMDDMEAVMLDLSQSEAWKYVKRFIQAKLTEVAGSVREASNGAHSLEEVGFRYLAADQVNTFATQLVTFVEKYAAARTASDRSKQAEGEVTE